ncbi:MAG: TatD family hydrolase, partial [Actinomycetota bacterium]
HSFFFTTCMFYACYCHPARGGVGAPARAAGVETIVVPAVAAANFPAVQDCCRLHAGCLPAYGIHPMYVMDAREEDIGLLRDWLTREKPVAVGEIGLDFFVTDVDPVHQEWFFAEQLKLARDFGLPVLLHVRRAVDHILKHLRRIEVPGGIAHAFNGSRQQADEFIARGFKLGFGGTVTFEGSRRIRQLAATLPLEAIVLETDAPDIPPAWLNRGRNTPAELPRIGAEVAALRGMPVPELAGATSLNARRVLGLPSGT